MNPPLGGFTSDQKSIEIKHLQVQAYCNFGMIPAGPEEGPGPEESGFLLGSGRSSGIRISTRKQSLRNPDFYSEAEAGPEESGFLLGSGASGIRISTRKQIEGIRRQGLRII